MTEKKQQQQNPAKTIFTLQFERAFDRLSVLIKTNKKKKKEKDEIKERKKEFTSISL